jgi:hypothetical protein
MLRSLLALLALLLLAVPAAAQNGANNAACQQSASCVRAPIASSPPTLGQATDWVTQTSTGALRVGLEDGSGNDVSLSHGLPVILGAGGAIIGAVTQSGTWTVYDGADGPVTAGTAAGKSILDGCVYNTSLPSLSNTQQVAQQCDASGRQFVNVGVLPSLPAGTANVGGVMLAPTSSSSMAIASVVSSAAESNHPLKGSAGNLYGVSVTTGTISGFLMTFNATSAPSDGAVTPIACVVAPANATTSLTFSGRPPSYYSIGIVVVFSSTGCFTKTASATAFFAGDVQ